MEIISLPYGRSHLQVAVEGETTAVNVVAPRRGDVDLVRLALAAPLDSSPLRQLVQPGQTVAIVTSDITRPCPTWQLLPPVLDELHAGGVAPEDVFLVFGLGTHRPHTAAEQARLMGESYGRIRCMDTDPSDMVYLGTTTRGTPVEAFRPVVEADVRVALGTVEYHYFAGYSGGTKALVPGVCSPRTIQCNHSMMTREGARLGHIEGNPVRADIEEAASMIGLDFILNVIVDEGKVAVAVAGHPVAAHRWACRALDYLSMVRIPCCTDIVLVSAGGYPKDINMYQAQKALDNAAEAVRPGGIIIWVAECSEGLGHGTFEEWMVGASAESILQRIEREFVIGGHKAAAIARVQQHASIWLVSNLPAHTVRSCGMVPYQSVEDAMADAVKALGPDASITVMPEGASVVPGIADPE
jgi:lactate racemase